MERVPLLKGHENYFEWAILVNAVLTLDEKQKFIECEPDSENEEEVRQAEIARSMIILTVDTSLYVYIKKAKTALEVWTILKNLYSKVSRSEARRIIRTFGSNKLQDCNLMEEYTDQIIRKCELLNNSGFTMNDEFVGLMIMVGLPDNYIDISYLKEITPYIIQSKLIEYTQKENHKCSLCVQKKQYSKAKKIRCFRCKKLGHYRNQCTA